MWTILYYTNIALMVVALATAIRRFDLLDKCGRGFIVFLAANVACEATAGAVRLFHVDNNYVYNGFEGIKAFLILCYFDEVIDFGKRISLGLWLGVPFVLWSIGNVIFFRDDLLANSYLLYAEGFVILALAIVLQMQIARVGRRYDRASQLHFWISSDLLFFWSATMLSWFLIANHNQLGEGAMALVMGILLWVNFIFYGVLVFAFGSVRPDKAHQFN